MRILRKPASFSLLIALSLYGAACKLNANSASGGGTLTTQSIASKSLPAVVTVSAKDSGGNVLATGSGFFVAPKIIATNLHVIEGASQLSIKTSMGKNVNVAVVRTVDTQRDLALLDCPDVTDAPVLPLGDTSAVQVGDAIVAAGSPLGLEGSISTGIVSAAREQDGAHVFQITAPISHGSSGGPLLNGRGEVIGVTSFTVVSGQNLNFAYSAAYLKDLLKKPADKPAWTRGAKDGAADTVAGADFHAAVILNLLAQPTYCGDEFIRQAIGEAHLELVDEAAGRCYFSAPSKGVAGDTKSLVTKTASRFVTNTGRLEIAKLQDNEWQLGDYTLQHTAEKSAFFSVPITNIRFPNGLTFRFPYHAASYTISGAELQAYQENSAIYGGLLEADISAYYDVMGEESLANRGALVAKPGEPSLRRLVNALAPMKDSTKRVQKLADFVTQEIADDYAEASQAGQVLKNASNTLMTRRGSRGNKAVLLASLMEQVGTDYILVYSPRRIWVAVPQKGFAGSAGTTFDWDGVRWTLIDVATPGFKIGTTKITDAPPLSDLLFVQRPRQKEVIVDRTAGQSLGFR